jgi:hypothetical protein
MKDLADFWVECIEMKEYIENKYSSNFCSINKNCWQSKAWKLFEVPLCDPAHEILDPLLKLHPYNSMILSGIEVIRAPLPPTTAHLALNHHEVGEGK